MVNSQVHLKGVASQGNAIMTFVGQSVRTRYGYPRNNQVFSTNGNQRLIDVTANDVAINQNIVRPPNNTNCRLRYRQPTADGIQPRIGMRTRGN